MSDVGLTREDGLHPTHDDGLHPAPSSTLEYNPPEKEHETYHQYSEVQEAYSPTPDDSSEEPQSRRGWWGSRTMSTLLAVALAVVILAAAIGGGVGGAAAVRKAKRSCALTTNSSMVNLANYTLPEPWEVKTAYLNCGETSYTASSGLRFITDCGVDHPSNKPASNGNGTVGDLIGLMAYSMDACIEHCSQWNYYFGHGACAVAVWNDGVSYWWGAYQSNCWLKNATSASPSVGVNGQVAAKLVSLDYGSGNGTSGANGTSTGSLSATSGANGTSTVSVSPTSSHSATSVSSNVSARTNAVSVLASALGGVSSASARASPSS